jgi:hypothetical protein
MTPQDLSDCKSYGFSPAVIYLLQLADFQPAGDHKHQDGTYQPAFVRQGSLPQIYIVLDPRCDVREVITAIFEDGRKQGHEVLAASFMSFFDRCKRVPPASDLSALEKRLAAIEARQSDNQTMRQGAAHPVASHCLPV